MWEKIVNHHFALPYWFTTPRITNTGMEMISHMSTSCDPYPQQESAPINVVLNWFEELKRLVPTN
jgi:hypothetical protein